MSRTSEDILQDVCLTAMRKFQDCDDVDELTAIEYLEKTLYYELKFQRNRVDTRMLITDNLTEYDRGIDD